METQTFTTTDIIQCLKIPRERLRDWISRGFVNPSVPAPGQGKAAEFSIWDVYRIELFRVLIDGGFSRTTAAEFVKVVPEGDDENGPVSYIMFRREGDEIRSFTVLRGAGALSVDLAGGRIGVGPHGYFDPRQIKDSKFDPENWDNLHLVNFEKIRKTVDMAFNR